MKTTLLLAEGASQHLDGSITFFRAGITRVSGKQLPLTFRGSLVALIAPDMDLRVGDHAFRFAMLDPNGKEIFQSGGEFKIGDREGGAMVVMTTNLAWPAAGKYRVVASIDGKDEATMYIHAVVEQGAPANA